VQRWTEAIRHEQALASTPHTLAQVDRWELAHDDEEIARNVAKAAKTAYESGLRELIFGF
jgi:hypothetical protein